MIQRDLSFYYPDCNKEVCLVIASESLQCITQVIASYSLEARGGNLAKIPPNQVIDDFGRGSSVESESE